MKGITPAGRVQLPLVNNRPQEITDRREGHSFKEVLSGVSEALQSSSDIYRSLQDFERSVISGKGLSPKELLVFQIRASQFGVHVELLSKVAESGLNAIRKLQQT